MRWWKIGRGRLLHALRASRTLDKSLSAGGGKICQGENGTTAFHLPSLDAREHPRAEEARSGSNLDGEYTQPFFVFAFVRKAGIMDIWEFLTSYYFMGIMGVLLLVLIGVLLFLRSRRPED